MSPQSPEKYSDLSLIQRRFIETLDDRRVTEITAAADLVGALNVETLDFLRNAKPETLRFLKEARTEEIENLKDGIRLVVATQLLGRVGRWTIVTLFGTIAGTLLIWDGLSKLWKKQ